METDPLANLIRQASATPPPPMPSPSAAPRRPGIGAALVLLGLFSGALVTVPVAIWLAVDPMAALAGFAAGDTGYLMFGAP